MPLVASMTANAADDYDAAATKAAIIVKEELMEKYQGEKGLLVKPMDIDAKENPKLKALDEKYPDLWNEMNPVIAEAYAATVKSVNDKNNAKAAEIRPFLTDAFKKSIELRGGGSGSSMMLAYTTAHVEWMIGNGGKKKYPKMADDAFISELIKLINYDNLPDKNARIREELQVVLKSMKQAEALLPDDQAGFIRAEFLAFLE